MHTSRLSKLVVFKVVITNLGFCKLLMSSTAPVFYCKDIKLKNECTLKANKIEKVSSARKRFQLFK